ncbi:MAG: lipoprotein insertase outer membrane protein LolB [Gammaproteobacteria bacterium]|jgi:outer membrane lipoprotein LolB|nr:lipoprotein insertase outer membrane protein LolB [Gammaproteobacteria bacterium]MDG2339553.1 lipoprotein insertase outer membrane protein LolB [Gammaproteobacteria bacterium]
MKAAIIHDLYRVAVGRMLRLALLGTFLSTCAIAPPASENSDWSRQRDQLQELDSWELRGRVNVRYDNESHTPRIIWLQQNVDYNIRLWGTFNAGATEIVGRPGFVTMENDGQTLSANSPEDLILEQLGYELPVSQLNYWIKGLPAPESEAQLVFNELNQLTTIQQADWTINLSDMRQYGALNLPRRVELTRPRNDIRLRFIGLNWTGGALTEQ